MAEAGGRVTVWGRLGQCLFWLAWTAFLGVGVTCALAPYSYHADLVSNFRWPFLWWGLGLLTIATLVRRPRWVLLSLLLWAPHAVHVLPYYFPPRWLLAQKQDRAWPPVAQANTPLESGLGPSALDGAAAQVAAAEFSRLRIVNVNLLYSNRQHAAVLDWVREVLPDVLVVHECTEGWFPVLVDGLRATHPHHSGDVFPTWTGTRVFSRFPLRMASELESFPAGPLADNCLAVTVEWGGRRLIVIADHPPSPTDRSRFQRRNERLAELEQFGVMSTDPWVIAGDFNCSSGSPYFIARPELHDTRWGFGWQPSWPTWAPDFLRVPIDHIFVSRDWRVLDRRLGPMLGSDHLPVLVDLEWTQPAAATVPAALGLGD